MSRLLLVGLLFAAACTDDAPGAGDPSSPGGGGGSASGSGSPSGSGGSSGGVSGGPQFPGAGTSGSAGALPGAELTCFYGGAFVDVPAATVEYVTEVMQGVDTVHARVIFHPHFVDNSYGANAIGWSPRRGHTFDPDLVKSDHAELSFLDGSLVSQLKVKVDYISVKAGAPSGFGTLGIKGGDGSLLAGDAANVVATMTSLDRNLNERGLGSYTVDSPATDANYTPNPAAPEWDFRVVYEAWVKKSLFGAAGFKRVDMTYVHASPAKGGGDTIYVTEGDCPPGWSGGSAGADGGVDGGKGPGIGSDDGGSGVGGDGGAGVL